VRSPPSTSRKAVRSSGAGRSSSGGGISPRATRLNTFTHWAWLAASAGSQRRAVASKPPSRASASWQAMQCRSRSACRTGAAASAAATALSATAATLAAIAGGDLANTHRLCFAPEGATQQIQASTYTGSLDLTANAGFTVFDPALNIGSISRNGINAVAPLVQISPGFTARLALVNRGSVSRDYTVAAVSESGVTLTLSGALAGGTLAANQTRIIEMNNLISGGLRGSLW